MVVMPTLAIGRQRHPPAVGGEVVGRKLTNLCEPRAFLGKGLLDVCGALDAGE